VKRKAHGFLVFWGNMQLEQNRQEIDEIDAKLLGLLDQRAKIVREIGEIKLRAGIPVLDWQREAEIITRAARNNPGGLSNAALARIYRAILRESRQIQKELAETVDANGVVRS
jgi:3-deoxy-7-phosphoheptulonate synthase/chorismate mutase